MNWITTKAVIVQHCAVDGRLETPIRAYALGEPSYNPTRPGTKEAAQIAVYFQAPRKRKIASVRIMADNLRYLLIEVQGQTVYDSRTDVPCDMAQWEATNARFRRNRPFTTYQTRAEQQARLEQRGQPQ